MIVYLAIIIVLIWTTFLAVLTSYKPHLWQNESENQPFVSVLISLRNEEINIEHLCDSLRNLTYPQSSFEILIGNDDSEDRTLELLEKYKPENAIIYSFNGRETGQYGKQKVLTFLAEKAQGVYFLFTDADMVLQEEWIQGMLTHTNDRKGIVVGMTKVADKDTWSMMQNMDWLFNEWLIGWCSKFNFHLTAWGNNMTISKSHYFDIGSYGTMDSTIVEDVHLLRNSLKNGGELIFNCNPSVVATTKPANSVIELLFQRKRWMKGLIGSSPLVVIGGLIKMLFWPAMVLLALVDSSWVGIIIVVIGLKMYILRRISRYAKCQISLMHLLIFEIYDFVFYLITFAFYLLPVRVVWKGRRY